MPRTVSSPGQMQVSASSLFSKAVRLSGHCTGALDAAAVARGAAAPSARRKRKLAR